MENLVTTEQEWLAMSVDQKLTKLLADINAIEIAFKLMDREQRLFLGRIAALENKVIALERQS